MRGEEGKSMYETHKRRKWEEEFVKKKKEKEKALRVFPPLLCLYLPPAASLPTR